MVFKGPEKHVLLLQGPFNPVSVLNLKLIFGLCTKECVFAKPLMFVRQNFDCRCVHGNGSKMG